MNCWILERFLLKSCTSARLIYLSADTKLLITTANRTAVGNTLGITVGTLVGTLAGAIDGPVGLLDGTGVGQPGM